MANLDLKHSNRSHCLYLLKMKLSISRHLWVMLLLQSMLQEMGSKQQIIVSINKVCCQLTLFLSLTFSHASKHDRTYVWNGSIRSSIFSSLNFVLLVLSINHNIARKGSTTFPSNSAYGHSWSGITAFLCIGQRTFKVCLPYLISEQSTNT